MSFQRFPILTNVGATRSATSIDILRRVVVEREVWEPKLVPRLPAHHLMRTRPNAGIWQLPLIVVQIPGPTRTTSRRYVYVVIGQMMKQ